MKEILSRADWEELKSISVLYVEDEPDVREQLTESLRRRVGRLWMAEDGWEGLELFRQHHPQMVVTDILMPGMDGLRMAEAIRQVEPSVPILVTTAFEQVDYLLRSIEIGVDGYVTKPVNLEQLYAAMGKCARVLLSEQSLRESEERFRSVIAALFEGVVLIDASGMIRASNISAERILGLSLDQLVGRTPFHPRWQVIQEDGSVFPDDMQPTWITLRTGQACHNVIMGIRKTDGSLTWLLVNAEALYRPGEPKPYAVVASFADVTERKRVEEELRALQAQLREEAIRDPLTGLYNRRYLEETLKRELARAAREERPLSILMGDIDHFKRLNDTSGHQAGDEVLKALGDVLWRNVRSSDIPCRYGGEEFVVIMPDMPWQAAQERAEQVRRKFAELRIAFLGVQLGATVSIGVSAYPEQGATVEELIGAADQALYEAKQSGRNRVCSAGHSGLNMEDFA